MLFPQELIDAVIDCIGAQSTFDFAIGSYISHPYRTGKSADELKSLALASRACNHRARSHLFAKCRVANINPRSFDQFEQCPDVLLGYTRVLTVHYDTTPTTMLAILRRFVSSPLVSVNFYSMRISEGLLEMLKSFLPNVSHIKVVHCTLNPVILINLVSTLDHRSELCLQGCGVTTVLEEDDNLPSLPPLQGRLSISDSRHLYLDPMGLLSRVALPLRSLDCTSRIHPSENKLIGACAGSLENLEVKMVVDWTQPGFTLDLGLCTNLQHISFISICDQDKSVITQPLSKLLLSLREHQLSSVRFVPKPDLRFPGSSLGPRGLMAWERLDQILCKLGGQALARGEILTFTFQSAPFTTITNRTLAGLLPRFNQIGICVWTAV